MSYPIYVNIYKFIKGLLTKPCQQSHNLFFYETYKKLMFFPWSTREMVDRYVQAGLRYKNNASSILKNL